MTVTTALSTAQIIGDAVLLISARGLCIDDYESPAGELDPSGAVATVLGMDADVWCSPPVFVLESEEYQAGFRALYALVVSYGYDMRLPEGEEWEGEELARHIAFWLEDQRPLMAEVVDWMREVAS